MTESDKQLEILLQAIFDCQKHHLYHNLFPPKQLLGELKITADNVRKKYLVPDGNDVYGFITVTPHVSDAQVLFHVSIIELFNCCNKRYQKRPLYL